MGIPGVATRICHVTSGSILAIAKTMANGLLMQIMFRMQTSAQAPAML